MFRYALKIEYDGTLFHGWQKQSQLKTVQGEINLALRNLDNLSEGVTGAGRTDAGVHATGQVAHVDMNTEWEPIKLQNALNYYLKPRPIAIVGAVKVNSNFHSRFSAQERYYLFKILIRPAPLTLDKNRFWHVRRHLDVKKMVEGASYLIGRHDFTTFRSSSCQAKSPIKTIEKIIINETEIELGSVIEIRLKAQSFLHNQVRSIAGTLEKVGSGNWVPEQVGAALSKKNRTACGPVAPPMGLYLTKINYREPIFRDRIDPENI